MDARDFSLWISALDGHQRLQAGDGRGHARHRAGVQDRSRVFAATGPPPCGAPAMAARSLPDPRRTHEYAPALRNQHGYPRLGGGKPPCGGAGRGGGPSPPSPPHRSRCPTPPHRGTPRRARAARTPRACPPRRGGGSRESARRGPAPRHIRRRNRVRTAPPSQRTEWEHGETVQGCLVHGDPGPCMNDDFRSRRDRQKVSVRVEGGQTPARESVVVIGHDGLLLVSLGSAAAAILEEVHVWPRTLFLSTRHGRRTGGAAIASRAETMDPGNRSAR